MKKAAAFVLLFLFLLNCFSMPLYSLLFELKAELEIARARAGGHVQTLFISASDRTDGSYVRVSGEEILCHGARYDIVSEDEAAGQLVLQVVSDESENLLAEDDDNDTRQNDFSQIGKLITKDYLADSDNPPHVSPSFAVCFATITASANCGVSLPQIPPPRIS